MREFLGEDFLLESATAQQLYDEYASKMPIIDYHSHIQVGDIAKDKQYKTITDVWLGGDHYKWRAMRCNGIPESRITGGKDTDPYDTFLAFAETLQRCIGNPLYHWAHLELQRYFGLSTPLTPETAPEIYARCNMMLADSRMSVRGLIRQSRVEVLCSTDDPVDDLADHHAIAADETCDFKVLPTFRPDRAMNINLPGFPAYLEALSEAEGVPIHSYEDFQKVLTLRMEYFGVAGCKVSDHALDYPVCALASKEEINQIFQKAKCGEPLTGLEVDQFKTAFLTFVAKEYHRLGWVMQIHYGCVRNISQKMAGLLGPDTGYDAIGKSGEGIALAGLLNQFEQSGGFPKLVLYSLNQYDNEIIATIAGAFQTNSSAKGRVQLGASWWFNDTKSGMEKHLVDFGNLGVLGNFIGMLTDSRSFLSYTRHEYFRRILCNYLGSLVEKGEYPADIPTLGAIVEDISYRNTAAFFSF